MAGHVLRTFGSQASWMGTIAYLECRNFATFQTGKNIIFMY